MIDFLEKFQDYLYKKGSGKNIQKTYNEWAKTPADYLGGKTPEEYFNEIESIDDLIKMFEIYKKDMPPLLINRIKSFKSKAVKPLSKLFLDSKVLLDPEKQYMALNGIYITGELDYAASVPPLLKVMEKAPEGTLPFQYAMDSVLKIGEKAVNSIIKEITSTESDVARTYFAWLISRIEKSDRVFETLADLCRNSPLWKSYYAEILAEYGDLRGIDVIREVALEKKYSYEERDQFERALVLLGGEWDWNLEKKLFLERKKEEILERQEMVYIPAGEFLMGSSNGFSNEKPLHKVYVKAFWIDKYPVTVGEYREFVKLTGHKSEPDEYRPEEEFSDDMPITYVSWNDASAYASWMGKRLPTEAEWEKAARGTDGREWPWGNEWDREKLASREGNHTAPVPVGKFPGGQSPYGVMDMAGNVWEWTSDSERPYPYEGPFEDENLKIFRGGSWSHDKKYARCSMRYTAGQDGWANDLGFRCVMSAGK